MFGERFFKGEGFFNGHRYDSPFRKGDLKYVILDLLKEKPGYGYEIIRNLQECSHGFYKPSPGSVYPTLQMLEEMGYLISSERDGKKVYEITPEGLNFLKERKDTTDHVKSHMKRHWNYENFESVGRIVREISGIKRSLGPRMRYINSEKVKQISEIISEAREKIENILE